MLTILFDTNAYDRLGRDVLTRQLIKDCVANGYIRVVINRTVMKELSDSPFGKIPDFFPVEYVCNTVARVGYMCVGDRLGTGEIFDKHRGTSTKISDALVADAAAWGADWLVSQDQRLCKRLNEQSVNCKAMSYSVFVESLISRLAI